ncbi:A24 family peptidase [Paraburkholderia hospita]|jgi:prepilin peptidase CpaA|uniref:Pilus assembly protein CpaA n=1 Tax=Paraburkholderia hospita TaxID=169430 RepID=A0AAN1J8E1_9BURK|nr:prepilin peptidase [Paraburkholderia hospita]AUT69238.1 pilus assembly protein CpaA [Paraburkholderia hospita]SEI16582.1 prepilin peptidase CpaA [Paraburkholderia hospita]
MNAFEFPVGLCLLALVVIASWTDLRARRIPNWLVLVGAVLGLPVQCYLHGVGAGFSEWLLGMLIGGGLFLPLYALRAMGAGDVKLMGSIGAFVGSWAVFRIVLLTFIVGGIWALILLVAGRQMRPAFANIRGMLLAMIGRSQQADPSAGPSGRASVGSLPFAVAIALGTVGAMCLQTASLVF